MSGKPQPNISLTAGATSSSPFPHVVLPTSFAGSYISDLLNWLENDAPWELTNESFYTQFEFSFADLKTAPDYILDLNNPSMLSPLRRSMESWFETGLSDKVDLTAHKLVSGHEIGVHNDYLPGGETHRLIVAINREWTPDFGGFLLLLGGENPNTLSKIIPPHSGSAFAFPISTKSYHAVSRIRYGERFSLIYSFTAIS